MREPKEKTVKLKPRGKAFPKGNNANPKGRPLKELTFKNVLQRKLADEMTPEEYEKAVATVEFMADQIIRNAVRISKSDPKEFREHVAFMRDTTEGKPTQRQELTGADGAELFKRDTFTLEP